MTMVYRRLNYPEKIAFHFDKIKKSKNLHVTDLCSYGYWRCFDKTWKQNDFFDYGKFLDKNLSIFPRDNLIKSAIENKTICVTGAGGSIGRELTKQIISFKPKNLILFRNGCFQEQGAPVGACSHRKGFQEIIKKKCKIFLKIKIPNNSKKI